MTQQKDGINFRVEAAANLITAYGPIFLALFISLIGPKPVLGLALFICGFLLFAYSKIMNFNKGQWISFGSKSMTSGQRLIYRIGYGFMFLGFLGILSAAAFTRMTSP